MELKLNDWSGTARRGELLIVPYGIETRFELDKIVGGKLLIVPYGIETCKGTRRKRD